MKVKIKRFDKDLPLPKRQTEGSAAFDLTARETVTIPPRGAGKIPLNVAVETPPGYFLLIAARSSIYKKGLLTANGIGIIDPDFSGDEDEINSLYYNVTDAPVTIEKGERIAQGMFVPILSFDWSEADQMEKKSRGGFGSTGKK